MNITDFSHILLLRGLIDSTTRELTLTTWLLSSEIMVTTTIQWNWEI